MTCLRCGGRLRVARAYLNGPESSLTVLEEYLVCVRGCRGTLPMPPDGMPKRCPRCREMKPRSEFNSNGYCKPCRREYFREWWHKYARERLKPRWQEEAA